MADVQKVRRSKTRDYPPLIFAALALLLMLGILPSALNLPQTNPSQTLEYAPVPPEDENTPDPSGNFSALGLGSSATAGKSGEVGPGEGPGGGGTGPGGRAVKAPSTKRCGSPPRQTEDPASPPCVAFFEGDNGGATYNGVTKDEVRVILYRDGGFTRPTSRGQEKSPQDKCIDLGLAPADDEDVDARVYRALQRYFNDRYQTYGRFVRFIACFADATDTSVESRRADAADHLLKYKPFAFNNMATQGNATTYSEQMLRKGVLGFTALAFQPASTFQKFAPLTWGYAPSVEQYARVFSSYVCTKVVPHRVSFSGNSGHNGQPRKIGILRTDNSYFPGLVQFHQLVASEIRKCGADVVAEAIYPFPYTMPAISTERPNYGQENMAAFQGQGVTTIVWPGGWEAEHTKAAAQLQYRPEWVMAGDNEIEGYDIGQFQEPSVWQHAAIVTNAPREITYDENMCYAALREVDPSFPQQDASYTCPQGRIYESLRQLFTGIQVAGPRLNPASLEKGQRAIPAVRSKRSPRGGVLLPPG